jgi:hypothetical protein
MKHKDYNSISEDEAMKEYCQQVADAQPKSKPKTQEPIKVEVTQIANDTWSSRLWALILVVISALLAYILKG